MNIYDAIVAGILGKPTKEDLDNYLSYGMLTQDQYNQLATTDNPQSQTQPNQPNATNQ